ncbi:MAG: hypothetical protein M3H12_06525, partial [Chromatiales bacterium]
MNYITPPTSKLNTPTWHEQVELRSGRATSGYAVSAEYLKASDAARDALHDIIASIRQMESL